MSPSSKSDWPLGSSSATISTMFTACVAFMSPSPRHRVHYIILHTICHLHMSPHHDIMSTTSSSTTSVTSMCLLITASCPLHSPQQSLSPSCVSSSRHHVHYILLHNLCHLHMSPHHGIMSTTSSSTTSVTFICLLITTSCPLHPPPQHLSPSYVSSSRHHEVVEEDVVDMMS